MAGAAGLGDDFGFARVLFGVKYVVFDAELGQEAGDEFGGFDGGGAQQHGLAAFFAFAHVGGDGVVFAFLVEVDEVGVVFALHRAVGGDDDGFEAVDVLEFEGFGVGGAGHARQFVVEAEEVLVGDGGECLGFLFDGHAFFDFDGLVQAV